MTSFQNSWLMLYGGLGLRSFIAISSQRACRSWLCPFRKCVVSDLSLIVPSFLCQSAFTHRADNWAART